MNSRPDLFQRAERLLSTHAVNAHNLIVENIKSDPFADKSDDEVLDILKANGYGEYKTADEIKAEAEERFLDEMAKDEEACFEKLVDFAHCFWDEFVSHLNREKFYKYLDADDKTAYQKGFLDDMEFSDIERAIRSFGSENMILRYNEKVIRGALELVWLGDL